MFDWGTALAVARSGRVKKRKRTKDEVRANMIQIAAEVVEEYRN